ncbi:MAG: UDP-N-acetylmuramate--L-alanine ligase [Planctomycetes bacterium]|nr:UDP-N-acetylmuramate--L-alanine ligase [Planctomycetota bacterium]
MNTRRGRGTEAATGQVLLERMARPAGEAPLRVFLSGIGGTGLSGLARLLQGLGHSVSGSDRSVSPTLVQLREEGISVASRQGKQSLPPEFDLFVGTAALPHDHPELAEAQRRGVACVKYAEALGALVSAQRGVAIAGTHGKTTTTSLLTHLLRSCGRDPSWIVGGEPKDLPSSARAGSDPELIFEACEFDRSFHRYQPAVAAVLNLETDHLDCYAGLEELEESFATFLRGLTQGGAVVLQSDWPACRRVAVAALSERPDLELDTVSLESETVPAELRSLGHHHHYAARDLRPDGGLWRFTLVIDGRPSAEVRLGVPGRHNAANALMAIACAARAGVPAARAAQAVSAFTGVGRRYDVKATGDVVVVDDYAHHPTALEAVISATRERYPERRLVVCFEPHQANRTRHLFSDFVQALSGADRVLLADIYVCRDSPEDVASVSSQELAAAICERAPQTQARHAGDLDDLEEAARRLLQPGDVGLFLGAGRISQIAGDLAATLRAHGGQALEQSQSLSRRELRSPAASGAVARSVLSQSGRRRRPKGGSGFYARISGPLPRPSSARFERSQPAADLELIADLGLSGGAPSAPRLADQLALALGPLLQLDTSLARYTTLRVGGRSRFFVAPRTTAEAIHAQRIFQRHGVPVVLLGGGSNTLFASDYLDSAVLLTKQIRGAETAGHLIRATCGTSLPGILRLAERHGLGGLETFAGIPGTLGGAVFGNAGGPRGGNTVGQLVRRARVVEPDGRVRWRDRAGLGLTYRHSELAGCLVLDVELELSFDDMARLRATRREASAKKGASQPLWARSAGCTFRNPSGGSAGRLLDELGLKGLRRGGAVVSEHHANFIVNEGGASPADVIGLMEEIRERVRAARGIELHTELRLIA